MAIYATLPMYAPQGLNGLGLFPRAAWRRMMRPAPKALPQFVPFPRPVFPTQQPQWRFPKGLSRRFLGVGRRQAPELQGLGNFLKKVSKAVTRVAAAPIRLINKKAYDKVVAVGDKITDKVDAVYTKVQGGLQKFVKKNWKWIVIAAAVVATVYTMGGTAAILAKLTAAKSWLVAKAVAVKGWGVTKAAACLNGIKKLLGGQKVGDLNQQEVEAVADANKDSGQSLIPDQVLACFGQKPMNPQELEAQAQLEAEQAKQALQPPPPPPPPDDPNKPKEMPKWLPWALGAGALAMMVL